MAGKRMLIVDTEVAEKIDQNRGDMSYSDFLTFLIDSHLVEDTGNHNYISKEEFQHFTEGIKDLLRNFLDFFLIYGLELGKQPQDKTFDELSQKLQTLASTSNQTKNSK